MEISPARHEMINYDEYGISGRLKRSIQRLHAGMVIISGSPVEAERILQDFIDEAYGSIRARLIKAARAAPETGSLAAQAKPIIDQYQALWRERYGSTPRISVRDHQVAKKLIGDYGAQRVSRLLNRFFVTDGPYWDDKGGLTLDAFDKSWNRLSARDAKPQPPAEVVVGCRHSPQCVDGVMHSRKLLQDRASPHTISTPSDPSSGPASSTIPTSTKLPPR